MQMLIYSALLDSLLNSNLQEGSCFHQLSELSRLYINEMANDNCISFQLLRYVGRADYWVFSFEIIFCCFVTYYMVEEVMEIRKVKLDYFNSAWNIMDLIVILISLFNIIIAVYTEFVVTGLLKVLLNYYHSEHFGTRHMHSSLYIAYGQCTHYVLFQVAIWQTISLFYYILDSRILLYCLASSC